MRRGFLYLVVIMDWASRKVLSWRLSNTMDSDFCVDVLEDAFARYGKPEIFSTRQAPSKMGWIDGCSGIEKDFYLVHDRFESKNH